MGKVGKKCQVEPPELDKKFLMTARYAESESCTVSNSQLWVSRGYTLSMERMYYVYMASPCQTKDWSNEIPFFLSEVL